MTEKEGRTCLTCAKAKIKCDKVLSGKCGRCTRLGIECHAQLRGRGRPPNSASQLVPTPAAKATRAPPPKTAKPGKVVASDRKARTRVPTYKLKEFVEQAAESEEEDEEDPVSCAAWVV